MITRMWNVPRYNKHSTMKKTFGIHKATIIIVCIRQQREFERSSSYEINNFVPNKQYLI